ncbi:hypothetical protein F2Q70_00029228 [Brassica cretica]|uniref:F-box domain-containing protein n=1 Tax=Brassica cretica TaxID=69181 RepID=A0A8S9FPA9_BRACR|nr:hypothetical protein F2Q70_00029228 [Brassica cretica]
MNDKSEGKKEVIGSGLGRDWSELNREYLIDILSRLSLEERWSGPMLVCKPWMYACDDPSLNSVFDLYTWFERSRISNLWYSYGFEQKVDNLGEIERKREEKEERVFTKKRNRKTLERLSYHQRSPEPPQPEVTPACHQCSQTKPSSCSSRRDEAVATDHAAIGARTKPLEPPEVSPLCARALHAPPPEIASAAGPPPRHHRNAVTAAVLRLLLSPSSAVTANKPSPSVTVAGDSPATRQPG